MHKFNVKPFSVNEAWQGRRKRTPAYILFTHWVQCHFRKLLSRPELPKHGYLFSHYRFGVSNMRSDADKPVKTFQDALFSVLGTHADDDVRVRFMIVEKVKTRKGAEYIDWHVESEIELIPYLETLLSELRNKRSTKNAD